MAQPAAPTAGAPHKQRNIYTANHGTTLPGTSVRAEGGPASGDPATDEATFDLYSTKVQQLVDRLLAWHRGH
ncbi:MAG TPA: hypothetical protein VGN81_25475 [Pseudonocardiaceae bacterium]|jgi:hypothetical protein